MTIQYTNARKYFLVLFFATLFTPSIAQKKVVDSLLTRVKMAKHDTSKCQALTNFGEALLDNDKMDTALIVWRSGLNLIAKNEINASRSVKRAFEICRVNILNDIGIYYRNTGSIDSSLNYFKRALTLSEALDELLGKKKYQCLANSLSNLSTAYRTQGNIMVAIEFNYKGIKYYEKCGDSLGLAYCYVSTGLLLRQQNDLATAAVQMQKGLAIYEEQKNQVGMSYSMRELSNVYENYIDPTCKEDDLNCKMKNLKLALQLIKKAHAIQVQLGNKSGLAYNLLFTGRVYTKLQEQDSALVVFKQALALFEQVNFSRGICQALNQIALVLEKQGKLREALPNALRSFEIAKELGEPDNIMKSARTLKTIFQKTGRFKEAFEMQELATVIRDSITNDNNRKANIKKQLEYEYVKQAEKDSVINTIKIRDIETNHQQTLERQRLYTIGGVLLSVFLILAIVFMLRAARIKQKANEVISAQKQSIENANRDLQRQHQLNQKIFTLISHDFRGPMLSLALLLKKMQSKDENTNNQLQNTGNALDNANAVLTNLLSWANTEFSFNPIKSTECDIKETIQDLSQEFKERLLEKNVSLDVQVSDGAKLKIPLDILKIVLRNLLSNAIKYSFSDSTITISFDETSKELAVKNKGLSIPEEKVNTIFRQQVNSTRGTKGEEGFGIGLYMTTELLYKNSFTIRLDTSVEDEVRFVVKPV